MGIFKSYDIRGVWGKDWDARTARAIGRSLPGLLGAREICVGRDARLSSDEVFAAFAGGIREAGCGVADIGRCDTPAVYFATARYGFDAGVMITASHNPAQYNGLKISGREAVPVGYDTGLDRLEAMTSALLAAEAAPADGAAAVPAAAPGPCGRPALARHQDRLPRAPGAIPRRHREPEGRDRLLERDGIGVLPRRARRPPLHRGADVRRARRQVPQPRPEPPGRGEPRRAQGARARGARRPRPVLRRRRRPGDGRGREGPPRPGRPPHRPDRTLLLPDAPRTARGGDPGRELRHQVVARRRGGARAPRRGAPDVQGGPRVRQAPAAGVRGHHGRGAGRALLLPGELLLRLGLRRGPRAAFGALGRPTGRCPRRSPASAATPSRARSTSRCPKARWSSKRCAGSSPRAS